MKRLVKKVNILLVLVFFVFSLIPSFVFAAGPRTVRVGYAKIPGFQMQAADGTRTGYGYEFLQLLARYNQWTYEYIGYDKGQAELESMLQKGQIDVLIFVGKNAERQKLMDFSKEMAGTSAPVLVTKNSNSKFSSGTPAKYEGMRIGTVKGSILNQKFADYAKDKKFTYKVVSYDSVTKLNTALEAGAEIDAMLAGSLQDLTTYKVLVKLAPEPYYIAVKKGNTALLGEINASMAQLIANKPDFIQQLNEKHYQGNKHNTLSFTAAEQAFIGKTQKEEKKFKTLLRPDSIPLSYFDEQGKPQGRMLRLLHEVERLSGLRFEVVAVKTQSEYEKRAQDKDIALIFDSAMSNSEAEKAGFKLTDAYMTLPAGLLRLRGNNDSKTIAVVSGDRAGSAYAHAKFKLENVVMKASMAEAVDAVASHKVDICFGSVYSLNEIAANDKTHSLRVETIDGVSIPGAFAVKNTQDRALLSILDKAASNLSGEYVRGVLAGNAPLVQTDLSWQEYLLVNKGFAAALGMGLLFLIVLFVWGIVFYLRACKQRRISEEWESLLANLCLTYTAVEELDVDNDMVTSYILDEEGVLVEEKSMLTLQQFLNTMHPDDAEKCKQLDLQMILDRVMKTCSQWEIEVREKNASGDYRWVAYLLQGVRSNLQAHHRKCLLLKRDIDTVKNKELDARDQMAKALAEAKRTAEAKGSFMSKMSQEIRIPLNAIISYLDMLKDEKDPQEIQNFIDKTSVSAKQLMNFVNDVVDISSIENGKLKLNEFLFDFKQTISAVATMFYNKAAQKGVRFEMLMEDLEEEYVVGDRVRLNQILVNILSNAIKFTPAGNSVTCLVRQVEVKNKKVYMHFEITDTGKGMSEDFLKRLFRPFEQESNVVTGNYGGTGLGLSITYNLINMMKGSIDVESQPDIGTTFKVDLPFGYDAEQHLKAVGMPDFSGIRALIIDDQNNSAVYTAGLLEKFGVQSDIANSCSQGLEKLTADKNTQEHYRLCIVDWHMPEADGIEFLKGLRGIETSNLKVFMVTGYDYASIVDEVKSLGALALLNKPLFKSKIYDMLIDAFGAELEGADSVPGIDFGGKRVLLVEDNDISADITIRLLRKVSIKPERVTNGREACEKFGVASAGYYGAILMGIQLPEIDGYEAARLIRMSDHPEGPTIPIIAMADTVFAEDVAKALDSGMNASVGKPIDKDNLYGTLKSFMQ